MVTTGHRLGFQQREQQKFLDEDWMTSQITVMIVTTAPGDKMIALGTQVIQVVTPLESPGLEVTNNL